MLANEVASILNSQVTQTPSRNPDTELGKEDFLLLLVKQLSNQDPLEPLKNEDFMGQLASFSSLEQSINLNDSFTQFLAFQQLTQASTLIGKQVIAFVNTEDGVVPVTGVVDQVMMLDGKAILHLSNGNEVSLESVVSVQPAEEDSSGPKNRSDA